MSELTHLDEDGRASMVDVGHKETTSRQAVAEGSVYMAPSTLAAIRDGNVPKGDVLASARIAGIMAAKRTPDLIPLCHPPTPHKNRHRLRNRRTAKSRRHHRRSALQRPHRCRNGSAHRGQRGRAHDL